MIDYNKIGEEHFSYGIVIDAGSSGSRLHIYKWLLPEYIKSHLADHQELLSSVPHIISSPNWNKKITPGLSFYGKQLDKIWHDHLLPLVEFAQTIIPVTQIKKTPIFIQATAGMRLLPNKQQSKIINTVCSSLQKNSDFLMKNCQQQVQIIDGETEGIYGWLSLNYLANKFNNFRTDEDVHKSLGFMDMGGASTQIAFVPSNKAEVTKHKDDLSLVNLRSINGDLQSWNVFVSTWLGFGANQARRRYLKNLASLYSYGIEDNDNEDSDDEDEDNKVSQKKKTKKTRNLNDPCSPKGLSVDTEINGRMYNIKGIGDYDMCLKEQYPLLLKNLPCTDDPCLFNGVHVPHIDFEHDKFVGISEYWYTINDIFNLGGTYSFQQFNQQLKQFCESNWQDEIIKNFNDNKFNGIKLDYLKDSCFKGSWVINVLHEGFDLPRIDFEKDEKDSNPDQFYFKSAAQVNGYELSWTLGKVLLYASSQIPTPKGTRKDTGDGYSKYSHLVGIVPSETDQRLKNKQFIPGNYQISVSSKNSPIANFKNLPKADKISKVNSFFTLMVLFLIILTIILHFVNKKFGIAKLYNSILYQSSMGNTLLRFNHFSKLLLAKITINLHKIYNLILKKKSELNASDFHVSTFENDINLEEGLMFNSVPNPNPNSKLNDALRSNNHSFLNFNFNHASNPSNFNIYRNATANNSAASLYSIASLKNGGVQTQYNNPSTSNLASFDSGDHQLPSQLRSRVSLFNLNSSSNIHNNNIPNNNNSPITNSSNIGGLAGNTIVQNTNSFNNFSGASNSNANLLKMYKSSRNVALMGNLATLNSNTNNNNSNNNDINNANNNGGGQLGEGLPATKRVFSYTGAGYTKSPLGSPKNKENFD